MCPFAHYTANGMDDLGVIDATVICDSDTSAGAQKPLRRSARYYYAALRTRRHRSLRANRTPPLIRGLATAPEGAAETYFAWITRPNGDPSAVWPSPIVGCRAPHRQGAGADGDVEPAFLGAEPSALPLHGAQ